MAYPYSDRQLPSVCSLKLFLLVFILNLLSDNVGACQGICGSKINPNDKWSAAGFEIGRMTLQQDNRLDFSKKQHANGLLSFRYTRNFKEDNLDNLPNLSQPFGLCLDDPSVNGNLLNGLAKFKNIKMLSIRFCSISSENIKKISSLNKLTYLEISELSNTANTDIEANIKDFNDGLIALHKLADLNFLNLSETPINNNGIKYLSKCKNIRILNLFHTDISDDAIDFITKMDALKVIDLRQTKISAEGIRRLRKTFPKTNILNDIDK